MAERQDIRWEQRFSSYEKALRQLTEAVALDQPNKFEEQGLVKAFEFTYELAWRTLKDFFEYQGVSGIIGSRDAFRRAFSEGIVRDGSVWMRMIESRNRTSHTYNEKTARDIVASIRNEFFPAFCELERVLLPRLSKTV